MKVIERLHRLAVAIALVAFVFLYTSAINHTPWEAFQAAITVAAKLWCILFAALLVLEWVFVSSTRSDQ